MDTLERQALSERGVAKVSGGPADIAGIDELPIQADEQGHPARLRNIIVALTNSSVDRESIVVACKAARRRGGEVYGVFGIVVPRKLALDDEMATETAIANQALDHAKAVADHLKVHLETEIIHTRHFGQALIQEAQDHDCALIVLGAPYRVGVNGQCSLTDTASYVLSYAPSRVWLVRGPATEAQYINGAPPLAAELSHV